MAAVARTRRNEPGWRRWGRVLITVFSLSNVLVTLGTFAAWRYAGTGSGRARLARLAQSRLTELVPGLRVRELGRDNGTTLLAAGIDVWDSEGRRAVHIDRLQVRPHWTSLLRRTVWLEEVRLEGLRIEGRPIRDTGRLNLAQLVSPRGPRDETAQPRSDGDAGHLPVPVRVDRVVIVDGAAAVWAGAEAPRLTVHDVALDARFDSAGRRTSAAVEQLSLVGTIDERTFTVAAAARGQWQTENGPELELVVDRVRVTGATPGGELTVRAGLKGPLGALNVWLVGSGPGGATATASGRLGLADGALGSYQLRFAAVAPAVAALFDSVPQGQAAVRGQVVGRGAPLATASELSLSVYVPPGELAGHEAGPAYVEGRAEGKAWRLERAELHAPGMVARATGTGEGPRIEAHASVDVRNVAAVRRNAGQRVSAAGAVPARGRGHLELAVERGADQRLRLHASGVADGLDAPSYALGRARFHATALAEGAGLDAVEAATVTLSGRGLRVGDWSFDRIGLRARADRSTLALSATASGPAGTAEIIAQGRRRADRIEVSLQRLELALAPPGPRQRLTLGRPAALLIRPGQEVRIADLDVRASGSLLSGQALLQGMARLKQPPAGSPWAQAQVSLIRLTTAGIPPVTGTVSALADGRRARGDVSLRMGSSAFTAKLDLPAPIRSSLGDVRLSRHGNVEVTLDSEDVDLASLPPLQRALSRHGLVGGRLTARAKVTGDIAEPEAHLALDVRAVELRNVTGDGRDAVIHTIPGIGASVQIGTAPSKLEASGTLSMYGAGVAQVSGTLGIGLGALLSGADVDVGRAPLNARVELPRFQINALKSLSDELRDTRGWLSGGATIGGTLAQPRGDAQVTITDVQVDRLAVGRVAFDARTDGRTLHAQARIHGGATTGTLNAAGQLSLGPSQALQMRVQARGLNPGVLRPFLTGVRELDGVVDADVRATGALPAPRFEGRLYAYRTRLGVIGQPTFHDVGLALSMRPARLELEKLQMYSGGGSLEAHGWVALDGLQPRGGVLTGQAHRFVVAAAGISGARLDGEWAVEVARRDSVLSGQIDVPHAAVWLPKIALGGRRPQRITPHDDVHFVDGASRAAAARDHAEAAGATGAQPLAINVKGKARTVYVRGKDLDLEFESTVALKTAPAGGPLQLLGAVRIRRGRIDVQGQRFDVESGTLTFDGAPGDPRIDIRLSHSYPEARVIIELHGRPAKPELRLASEPPVYDQGQIVSLILTGQAQGRPGGGGSFDPTATIATAVVKKLADKVAPELGLDVVRIERAKPGDAEATAGGDFAGRIEVGKYVSDRVYVSYAHRFGATERQNANEAHAEYRISPHWLAETVFGDAGVGGVDAFWIYRY